MNNKNQDHQPLRAAPTQSLAGLYFHSFGDDGSVQWQGTILGHVQDGVHLVQLYSWLSTEPSNLRLVPLASMLDWSLYPDRDSMVDAWERKLSRQHQ